jgi:hypothetical protein
MLNFICTTMVCVQQYLSIGGIVVSDGQRFIWDGFNGDYICTSSSNIYQCSRITLPTYWYR